MSVPPASHLTRAPSWQRVLLLLLSVLLFLGAAALALLTLGLFSSLAANGPLWLQSLGVIAAGATQALGLGGLSGVAQAFTLVGLTSLTAALAAYLKPRA